MSLGYGYWTFFSLEVIVITNVFFMRIMDKKRKGDS